MTCAFDIANLWSSSSLLQSERDRKKPFFARLLCAPTSSSSSRFLLVVSGLLAFFLICKISILQAESAHSSANHRGDYDCCNNRLEETMNNPCVIPARPEDVVGDKRWESMHKRYVAEARTSEPEVVFVGDSIVQQLQFSTIWTEKINSLHCLNFGIGGDRVEYVLWRILNGEFEFNVPIKAVVVFVGTNNTDCTPHEVFEGLLEIVRAVKSKLGGVAIVLPTLLPRGQNPNPYRERNDHVNTFLLDKFENPANAEPGLTENVHVVRIDGGIVQGDQTISHHVMHDYLHLTDSGYAKIFEPVLGKLMQILKN